MHIKRRPSVPKYAVPIIVLEPMKESIALYVFCAPNLLSLASTACDGTSFDGTDTAVDEWQSLWLSSSAFALYLRRG